MDTDSERDLSSPAARRSRIRNERCSCSWDATEHKYARYFSDARNRVNRELEGDSWLQGGKERCNFSTGAVEHKYARYFSDARNRVIRELEGDSWLQGGKEPCLLNYQRADSYYQRNNRSNLRADGPHMDSSERDGVLTEDQPERGAIASGKLVNDQRTTVVVIVVNPKLCPLCSEDAPDGDSQQGFGQPELQPPKYGQPPNGPMIARCDDKCPAICNHVSPDKQAALRPFSAGNRQSYRPGYGQGASNHYGPDDPLRTDCQPCLDGSQQPAPPRYSVPANNARGGTCRNYMDNEGNLTNLEGILDSLVPNEGCLKYLKKMSKGTGAATKKKRRKTEIPFDRFVSPPIILPPKTQCQPCCQPCCQIPCKARCRPCCGMRCSPWC